MAVVIKAELEKAINEANVPELIEYAEKGDSEACKTLWRWFRNGTNVQAIEAVSIAFGLYYIAFTDNSELDEAVTKEIVNMIADATPAQLSAVYTWVKNAEFPKDNLIYKDLFLLAKNIRNKETPDMTSFARIWELREKGTLPRYTTHSYGVILAKAEVYKRRLEAEELYKKAVEISQYANNRDYITAISYYEKAAAEGIVKAKGALAKLYFFGIDNENHDKDPLMFSYLKESLADGNLQAATLLSECYRNGIGTEKDPKMALKYLLIANEINDNESFEKIDNGRLKELYADIENNRTISSGSRCEILSNMCYYGYGTNINRTKAVKYHFEGFATPEHMVFANKVPEMYGTEKRTSVYELCEETLRAGIELERNGRDNKNSEEERALSLELAKKYYIVALQECPRAAVYLLRFMMENRDPDFFPFAIMIVGYWVPNCEDSQKAINMAYYLLGLYYDYFYAEFQNKNYSEFIMKSNVYFEGDWIETQKVRSQDIATAKSCYSKAPRIDDASRRFGMLLDYK